LTLLRDGIRIAPVGQAANTVCVPFVDPASGRPLRRVDDRLESDGASYPVADGIPRFVSVESYAAGFGLEWTIHSQTQLDSRTGRTVSRTRLERCLGMPVSETQGLRVLEVGCGAGRFTELLVEAGAIVHAVDLSCAIEVNRANVGAVDNYVAAQADLRRLPFPYESFDLVIGLGVFQHTPSPEESIEAAWRMVRPGGMLVLDHYTWTLSRLTKLDSLLRPIVKRLPPLTAKRFTDGVVAVFFPLHWHVRNNRWRIGGVPVLQMLLSRVSPMSWNYAVSPHMHRAYHCESSRLDTFDHLADRYKRLRTPRQIRSLLVRLGASDVTVQRDGNGVEARCRKPALPAS
jgi:SAM-dependent methyltransferase